MCGEEGAREGAQGHEGSRGKWQPPGLRPAADVAAGAAASGRRDLAASFSCVFGGWRKGGHGKSPRAVARSAPALFSRPLAAVPAGGLGNPSLRHPPQAPRAGAPEGLENDVGAAIYCVLRPGGVAPVSEV